MVSYIFESPSEKEEPFGSSSMDEALLFFFKKKALQF